MPRSETIERVVVGSGMDEADNWIVKRARAGGIVITADVPLASRCVNRAHRLHHQRKLFTEKSIGMVLAMRNLMEQLCAAPA